MSNREDKFLAGILMAYPQAGKHIDKIYKEKEHWYINRENESLYSGQVIIADERGIKQRSKGIKAGLILKFLDEKTNEAKKISDEFENKIKEVFKNDIIPIYDVKTYRVFIVKNKVYPVFTVYTKEIKHNLGQEKISIIVEHEKSAYGMPIDSMEISSLVQWQYDQCDRCQMIKNTGIKLDKILFNALGKEKSKKLIEIIKNLKNEAIIYLNNEKIEKMGLKLNPEIKRIACKDGYITCNLSLKKGIGWESIFSSQKRDKSTVIIQSLLPDSIITSIKGKPLKALITHPWLLSEYLIEDIEIDEKVKIKQTEIITKLETIDEYDVDKLLKI